MILFSFSFNTGRVEREYMIKRILSLTWLIDSSSFENIISF